MLRCAPQVLFILITREEIYKVYDKDTGPQAAHALDFITSTRTHDFEIHAENPGKIHGKSELPLPVVCLRPIELDFFSCLLGIQVG